MQWVGLEKGGQHKRYLKTFAGLQDNKKFYSLIRFRVFSAGAISLLLGSGLNVGVCCNAPNELLFWLLIFLWV
jgi:hypothetical protein